MRTAEAMCRGTKLFRALLLKKGIRICANGPVLTKIMVDAKPLSYNQAGALVKWF